jgi:hypothetical protein
LNDTGFPLVKIGLGNVISFCLLGTRLIFQTGTVYGLRDNTPEQSGPAQKPMSLAIPDKAQVFLIKAQVYHNSSGDARYTTCKGPWIQTPSYPRSHS